MVSRGRGRKLEASLTLRRGTRSNNFFTFRHGIQSLGLPLVPLLLGSVARFLADRTKYRQLGSFIILVLRNIAKLAQVVALAQSVMLCSMFVAISADDIESGKVRLSAACPIRAATGHPCATCGITRGLAAMGHLDFARAWAYNPASVALYLAEFGVAVAGGIMVLRPRNSAKEWLAGSSS
jgi:hypothetical protein